MGFEPADHVTFHPNGGKLELQPPIVIALLIESLHAISSVHNFNDINIIKTIATNHSTHANKIPKALNSRFNGWGVPLYIARGRTLKRNRVLQVLPQ